MNVITLDKATIGKLYTVTKINGEGGLKRRIMEMGITKGIGIHIKKVAPLGDPIEITIRGYELSLRKQEASLIELKSSHIEIK